MEQQQQSLPDNIDSEILKLTSDTTAMLNSIAVGWKALTNALKAKDVEIEQLKAQIAEQPELGEQNDTESN